MAAVIAAILAGFLAGWVALLREHRIQERQLLVAARVMDEVLQTAHIGIDVALSSNDWKPFNLMPTHESFLQSWEAARGDLAGHLTYAEWQALAVAFGVYEVIRAMSKDEPPKESEKAMTSLHSRLETARRQLMPYRTRRFSLWRQLQRRFSRGDWSGTAKGKPGDAEA